MGWYNSGWDDVPFSDLVGKTITSVDGLERHNGSVDFFTSDGSRYRMEHHQDCCESVSIEDVSGDVNDLVNAVVLMADESSNSDQQPGQEIGEYYGDSFTWTFYRLQTNKGFVLIRWYGSSNGYYGEGVSFEKYEDKDDI